MSTSGCDFWIVVIPVCVTVHQKLRAPLLKIAHGFTSKLDAGSVPLIIRITLLYQWPNEEGLWLILLQLTFCKRSLTEGRGWQSEPHHFYTSVVSTHSGNLRVSQRDNLEHLSFPSEKLMWVGEVNKLKSVETNYFLHMPSNVRYFVERNSMCLRISSLTKYFL